MSRKKDARNIESPLSFPHVYVIEASAGSGKTTCLARRYVDFLLNYHNKTTLPFSFRNILAVTFTNEAADQMKQEILKTLKTRALAQDKDSEFSKQIVDEIVQDFSDFSVRTIDSFVHNLLIASSLELKLPPDYEILSQPRPQLEYVLDILLEELINKSDTSRLFLEFLEHFLIVEGQKHFNPKKTLLDLLNRFYREENSRAKLFKEFKTDLDLSKIEQDLKKGLARLLSCLESRLDCNQHFIKGLRALRDVSGLNFLKKFSFLANKDMAPGEGILNKKAPAASGELIQDWQVLKNQYHDYAYAFAWLRYNTYLKIFGKFRKHLEDFKEEKRIVFLGELNKRLRHFLTQEGLLPAEIYYKLSAVLSHYLIDEFQDTSILQWENIRALVEDALAKGGSLFYVGDKKQAIYRFRGGEVELFNQVKDEFKNKVDKIYDEVLLSNYRSKENIVNFNNSVFSAQSLGQFLGGFADLNQEHREEILSIFKDSQQQPAGGDSTGGYVKLESLEGATKQQLQEEANNKLRQTILQLRERFNYRDILILVRDNKEAGDITGFLLRQGFPVCAGRTVSIRQNYLIRGIVDLLKFLNSPIDNLCFASFILGEAFTKATGSSSEKMRSWMEDLRASKNVGVLYAQFRKAFPQLWKDYFQYLFNAVGFLPAYDLVETIITTFCIEGNFPDDCGFLKRLLEILNELQNKGENSLSGFLEWFTDTDEENLFVQLPLGLDAIRILTIHKAKGLSSEVVILPCLTLDPKVGEVPFEAPKIVCEKPEGLYLLYPQKNICQSHPELLAIYQNEYFRSLLDELNCLYVGLTRARVELYGFIPKKVNRADNVLVSLLLASGEEFKEIGSPGLKKTGHKQPPIEPCSQEGSFKTSPQNRFKNILIPQLISIEEISRANSKGMANRGELLHYLLAEIEAQDFLNDGLKHIPRIEDACSLFGYQDVDEVVSTLATFFKYSRSKKIFGARADFFNEKEIISSNGDLKRIDRLVVGETQVAVIDYKTGSQCTQAHQDQIKDYICLLQDIYPGKTHEGYLAYIDIPKLQQVVL